MTPMGEKVVQIILIVLAVMVGVTLLGWLLKALWWVAVIAGGIVVGGLVLGRMQK
jgi:hypothetical protein